MRTFLLVRLLAAALVTIPAQAGAGENDRSLEARITERIEIETDCQVDYISQLRDLREASPPSVEARVHCRDGTAYEIDWQLPRGRFRFERCPDTRSVCEAGQ